MKLKSSLSVAMAALPAAAVLLASCSTSPEGAGETVLIETADGAAVVETVTATATVTAIDSAKRKVTFVTPNGHKSVFKAGPEVVNFDQIKVGDQFKATLTEEFVVALRKGESSESLGAFTSVALAPRGVKPGAVFTDAVQETAKVMAVDTKHRKVTLQFPDGVSKNLKVGKRANLSELKAGDSVTVAVAQSLAIRVVSP